jgi:ankyrin repeat protein
VKHPLPTRTLPDRPDLDQLKRQAKELLETLRAAEQCDASESQIALHDAYLALARSYGYESWPKLKAYVDGVTIQRLMAAVRENDIEQVRSMLQRRPELINTVEAGNREYRPLHYAVFGRMPQMVRALMQLGADPHAGISPHTDATGSLTIAMERGYDNIAAIIREEEKRREDGRPTVDEVPLELRQAVQTGDEDAAITILERHPHLIKLQMPGNRRTLLHFASANSLERVAAWLVEHGANVNARSSDGSTPLEMAGSPEMVQLLRARGGELTPRSAVILGDEELLRSLHAQGTLADPQDDRGWLLSLAVDWDRPEILRLLLDLGLDPDARARVDDVDEIVFTWGMPLYQSVRAGNYEIAELLLERGATPAGHRYRKPTGSVT